MFTFLYDNLIYLFKHRIRDIPEKSTQQTTVEQRAKELGNLGRMSSPDRATESEFVTPDGR
jgi:hypothetical protein